VKTYDISWACVWKGGAEIDKALLVVVLVVVVTGSLDVEELELEELLEEDELEEVKLVYASGGTYLPTLTAAFAWRLTAVPNTGDDL